MTREDILNDLTYIKDVAEGGVTAPLVGGRIGLMWGILIAIVFTLQWGILSQTINIVPQKLFFVWLGFAVIGGLGRANFIVSAICFVAYGGLHIYLIGAVGIVLTVIIPSLITMKAEPSHVV